MRSSCPGWSGIPVAMTGGVDCWGRGGTCPATRRRYTAARMIRGVGNWCRRWRAAISGRSARPRTISTWIAVWWRSPSTPSPSATTRWCCSSTSWCCGWRSRCATTSSSPASRRRSPSWSSLRGVSARSRWCRSSPGRWICASGSPTRAPRVPSRRRWTGRFSISRAGSGRSPSAMTTWPRSPTPGYSNPKAMRRGRCSIRRSPISPAPRRCGMCCATASTPMRSTGGRARPSSG